MQHRRFRGLKQVPVPNQCYWERKEHPLRQGRHSLIVAGNLWGWPVSQVLETDDVRPLIGCLQRGRQQSAMLAAWMEGRTHEAMDGLMEGWRAWWEGAGGEGSRDEHKFGQSGMSKRRGGGSGGVMEKVSWWARRQFFAGDRCMADKVYLTPTPGSIGHQGGRRRWMFAFSSKTEIFVTTKDLKDSGGLGNMAQNAVQVHTVTCNWVKKLMWVKVNHMVAINRFWGITLFCIKHQKCNNLTWSYQISYT